jgi:hypothetical protein
MRDNGFNAPRNPILEPITTIENRDAILAWEDEQGQPITVWREGAKCRGQANWPEADFIVGNPPFLGSRLFGDFGLPRSYVDALHERFTIPNGSDLCCYWFSLADRYLREGQENTRVGMLATQGIRGQANRYVLQRIVDSSTIFEAHSDREWILDGAAVHVSIVCFAKSTSEIAKLDGVPVDSIHSDLTANVDTTKADSLLENASICSRGSQKRGGFDIDHETSRAMLANPNPHGESSIEVVVPWINGLDVARRNRSMWIIDFGGDRTEHQSSLFEEPFQFVVNNIKQERLGNNDRRLRESWWRHGIVQELARSAARTLPRIIVSPRVSKYRLFCFATKPTLPDDQLIVFARSDDYFFGVLHSSVHELWARRQGTQLREAESGFRYTPTTCFETFPRPWPPRPEPPAGTKHRPLHDAIAAAAKALNDQRERWLNPPEWIAEVAAEVDAKDDFTDVAKVSGPEAQRLIRQSAIDAGAAQHPKLKKRTLTNLYNERPTWLRLAHLALDRAVLNAYAATDPAPNDESGWTPAWAEVFEPTGAGQPLPEAHPLTQLRAETEQSILARLLALNAKRSGGA